LGGLFCAGVQNLAQEGGKPQPKTPDHEPAPPLDRVLLICKGGSALSSDGVRRAGAQPRDARNIRSTHVHKCRCYVHRAVQLSHGVIKDLSRVALATDSVGLFSYHPPSLLAIERDNHVDDVVDVGCRLPTEELAYLADIRDATRHVLEPFFICLIVGDVHDFGAAAGLSLDQASEIVDGNFASTADVQNLAHGTGVLRKRDQGLDDIADESEATRLHTIAVDCDRMSQQRLFDQAGNHHTVAARLPRSHGIE
jgi:hypothetical protein